MAGVYEEVGMAMNDDPVSTPVGFCIACGQMVHTHELKNPSAANGLLMHASCPQRPPT